MRNPRKRSKKSGQPADIFTFFDIKYEKWIRKPCGSRPRKESEWWNYIRSDFVKINRRVFKDLDKIYKKKSYHGRLSARSIQVTSDGRVKLTKSKRKELAFEAGVAVDFKELKKIWRHVLGSHFQNAFHIENYELPQDLVHLFNSFSNPISSGVSVRFLIDVPSFWSVGDKLRFIDKFYELDSILSWLKTEKIYNAIDSYFELDAWTRDIRHDDVLWAEYTDKYTDGSFNRYKRHFLRFMRTASIHYNEDRRKVELNWGKIESSWEAITRAEAVELLEGISYTFSTAYHFIREAIMHLASKCRIRVGRRYWLAVQHELLTGTLKISPEVSRKLWHIRKEAEAAGTWKSV